MCKLICFTDATKVKNLKKLVNEAKPVITADDDDGFGWAAQGQGGAFGERMSELFHDFRIDRKRFDVKLDIISKTYESFGKLQPVSGSLLMHGRTSTNSRSLLNTHPLRQDGWTLAHNGVVTNRGAYYKQATTNDTEHLLHYMATQGIDGVEANVGGYFAYTALAPDGRLHVCKDDIANLFVVWVQSIESYAFGTSIDQLTDLFKAMAWKHGPFERVQDNTYMIWDRNTLVSKRTIEPIGYAAAEAKLMERSLGFTMEPTSYKHGDYGTVYDASAEVLASGLTEQDETYMDAFLREAEEVNDSYTITWDNTIVTAGEFHKMDEMTKLQCDVIKPDGTVLSLESMQRGRSA